MGPATSVLFALGLVMLISSTCGHLFQGRYAGSSSAEAGFRDTSMSLSDQGRSNKPKKSRLVKLKVGLKILGVVLLVPLLGLVLLAAWKGVTIALLAFLISAIVGINSFLSRWNQNDNTFTHNVVVNRNPAALQEQWYRRVGGDIPQLFAAPMDPFQRVVPATGIATM